MTFTVKGYKIQIDDEDSDRVLAHSWWLSSSPELDGHVICFSTRVGKRIIKLHRFIMGEPAGRIVDHRNGDRLDNRKENLRVCGIGENNRNLGISRRNTSGYKGVSYSKQHGKFRAYIHLEGGHQKHLGLFDDPKIAAKAYQTAALIYFGDYCRRESV
jgi:hypothetical protein